MQLTKEKIIKCAKIGLIGLILVFAVVLLLLMPFVIDNIYECEPPALIFDVELSKSDLLDYYAQLLSLLATIVLGVIAVLQTYRSQKKSDEINALQLSIAQRELAVVEKQYEEGEKTVKAWMPRFEIRIDGYSGNYCNIKVQIKNVSDLTIYAFQNVSFEVHKGEEILPIKRWKLRFQSIASSEIQYVEIFTPNMRDNVEIFGKVEYWKNIRLVWKFTCEDCKGIKHFYSSNIFIPDTREHHNEFWEVIRIG